MRSSTSDPYIIFGNPFAEKRVRLLHSSFFFPHLFEHTQACQGPGFHVTALMVPVNRAPSFWFMQLLYPLDYSSTGSQGRGSCLRHRHEYHENTTASDSFIAVGSSYTAFSTKSSARAEVSASQMGPD